MDTIARETNMRMNILQHLHKMCYLCTCIYDAIYCTPTTIPQKWESTDRNSNEFEFEFNQKNYKSILIPRYGIRKYSTYTLLDILYYSFSPIPSLESVWTVQMVQLFEINTYYYRYCMIHSSHWNWNKQKFQSI